MLILKTLALIVILAISGLHFAWAAKLWWPISDEKQLVRTVAGFANAENMPPPASCFTVAIALCGLALLFVAEIVQKGPEQAISVALLGAGLVFFGRGAIGFTPIWARITPEQPFRQFGPEIILAVVLGSRFRNCDDCSVLARGE